MWSTCDTKDDILAGLKVEVQGVVGLRQYGKKRLVGGTRLPSVILALALLCLLGLIGLGVHLRDEAAQPTPNPSPEIAFAAPIVAFSLRPETIARVQATLRAQGIVLTAREEGIVPIARGEAEPPPRLPILSRPGQRPMIAIIIDDVGLVEPGSRAAIALDPAVTLSFLPYAPGVQAQADNAKAHGHEVMLHLPMEGREGANPGPHALFTHMTPAEAVQTLQWNLAQVRGINGVNNHMGSSFTADNVLMQPVLEQIRTAGLFYIDSRTSKYTVAATLATQLGLPVAERDVFLDNDIDAHYVALQLAEAEQRARKQGSAIAIGHPHAITLATLAQWQATLSAKGIDLVPVSRVIKARSSPSG